MKKIKYVTNNWAKIISAKQVLEPLGFGVEQIKMEVPEIQDNSIENIAKFSAKWASDKLEQTVIKNDSGLCIEALNGFPGPYTHYADDTIGEDAILKLLEGNENRKAYFIEAIAYCEYGKDPIVFVSKTKGKIAEEKSGKFGWSWDFIFIPEGESKTLGNFDDDTRFKFWNSDAYNELAEYLKNKEEVYGD